MNLTSEQVITDGEASASQRKRVQNIPDRGNKAGREQVSGNQGFLWLNTTSVVSSGTEKAGCGPLGLLPKSIGSRTQALHFRSVLVYVLGRLIRDRQDGKGQTTCLCEVMTKWMKTESLLHSTCRITS